MDLGWKKPWLALLGGILVLLSEVLGSDGCFEEERRALLDFKASYSNNPMAPSWADDPKSNCCAWERVTCDSSSGHVINLSLESFSGPSWDDVLGGTVCSSFPPLNWSIFLHFKDLRSLNLSDCCLDGFIRNGGTC
ncbi:hypothetical protein VNO77_28082 [Canavalia gladiata]|uniref:Leucine-rich repeat-containing N-terminal plant-type domain-containing protein n=1 Tax=Canavalia gladiata TaxID=3824 RepID=A0AAN9KWE3_CANGL